MTIERKKVEKIPYWKSSEFLNLNLYKDEKIELNELRKKQGFGKKKDIFLPYFYNGIFLEIFCYYNSESEETICELWDHNGPIFKFCVKNQNEYFEVIKEYLKICKDASILEKNIHDLKKISDEENDY